MTGSQLSSRRSRDDNPSPDRVQPHSMGTRLPHVLTALAVALLVGTIFGPALQVMGERFLGYQDVDAFGTQWFYWYVGTFLGDGRALGHTDLFFFPFGKDIYRHTGFNIMDALVALPFLRVLGPVPGYNAFCVFAMLLNGAAAWKLLTHVVDREEMLSGGAGAGSRVACLVGTALYALNPFLLSELLEGRATQVFQPFVPLFFLFLFRQADDAPAEQGPLWPRWKDAIFASLCLSITAVTYWFYGLFCGVAAIV
ncbi:MAG: hypothetical protein QGG40_19625, partial [Myxococcota bacterium]|nr:hypothetical protein [Myxococcota bacterium]